MRKLIVILINSILLFSHINAQSFWQQLAKLSTRATPYHQEIVFNSLGHVFFSNSGGGIFRSTDHGTNWTKLGKAPESYTIKVVANDRMLAGTYGEIFLSDDNGDSWRSVGTLYDWYSSTPYICLRFAVCKNGTILASAWEGGVYQSWDNGSSWSARGEEVGSNEVQFFAVLSNGKIYASSGDWIFESTDNGNTWKNVSRVSAKNNSGVMSIVCTKNNSIFVGMGHDGVYVSQDYARSWQPANSGIVTKQIVSLAIDSLGALWAGTDSSGVVYSANSGKSWKKINSGLTDSLYVTVSFGPDGYIYAGTAGGYVFRSSNPITSVRNRSNEVPTTFYLSQNYPNPFNPTTSINYSVPNTNFVTLKVYDILGRKIKTLVEEEKSPGNYEVKFNVNNLASGVYIYTISANGFAQSKKMLLMK